MHNAAFRATGIDGVYLPLPAADIEDFVAFANGFGLSGASVTIPYKVAIRDHVTTVQPLAQQVGAINTLKIDGQRWAGANSDVAGFLQPLRERGVPVAGSRVAVVGAGGSARAVSAGLQQEGAHVTVHARDAVRAQALVNDFAAVREGGVGASLGAWPVAPGCWDLLVNCTPVGMYPNVTPTPVPADALTGQVVYDLIYNPPVTRLLKQAAHAGAQEEEQAHNSRPPSASTTAGTASRCARKSPVTTTRSGSRSARDCSQWIFRV